MEQEKEGARTKQRDEDTGRWKQQSLETLLPAYVIDHPILSLFFKGVRKDHVYNQRLRSLEVNH